MQTLKTWMNSDDYDKQPPEIKTGAFQHFLQHMKNMQTAQMAQGAIQAGAQEAGGQPPQQQGGGQKPNPNQNPQFTSQRGQKGAAAKPHRPQPSAGNGAHVGNDKGMSHSAQQRRRNPK
jgi:hypothetical protein